MFQIAHGYAKALEFNRQFVVPYQESTSSHLENTLFRKIPFSIKTSTQSFDVKTIWGKFNFEELHPSENTPTAFAGWYQSEKYFKKFKEPVIDLFSPPISFLNKVFQIYPFFRNRIVAAINVRRGDYLTQPNRHPVVSKEYIENAYQRLPFHDKLLVVSDDIEWCKDNLKLPNTVFNDNSIFWDAEALWLLSLCDHFVISNSTFSWWGAYLSRSEDKTVIAPETWFGPEIQEPTQDLYCDDWIKLKTYYQDGQIKF
jgi:hypothetical protein